MRTWGVIVNVYFICTFVLL